ncbi:hypothetical protein BC940DRAFT_310751 [Gongronella butleri]|nr:hypothetical protein BC940DRAFT_310751 [Gongronella butleri]
MASFFILFSIFTMAGRPSHQVHQRKISLTSACPPSTQRADKLPSHAPVSGSVVSWLQRLWALRIIRSLRHRHRQGHWHRLDKVIPVPPEAARPDTMVDPSPLEEAVAKPLHINDLTTRLRLGKMFSKSTQLQAKNMHPFWFKAKGPVTPVSISTVLALEDLPALKAMADMWQGSISATIQIENNDGMGSGQTMEGLMRIHHAFEAAPILQQHVDLHIIVQPRGTKRTRLQAGRNLSRLFSRSQYVMHTPIHVLWLPNQAAVANDDTKRQLLDEGDALVVPTFAFPPNRHYQENPIDTFPTTKEEVINWVDEGQMGLGLMDYHWPLNAGPSNYQEWKTSDEPYMLGDFDYHYGPIYITTKENHPWCEERFEDQLPACVYTTYLNGAEFYVLNDVFVVRSGQEPENYLSYAERVLQDAMYKNFRIEQCAFFARQFDQHHLYSTERATHVKLECAKALQHEKIIHH